ncbi:MAG: hypothetical protein QOI36_2387 [Pseudonocardiales bacterium]|jgi:hypothetical protein|nr:hypothetical protein [Pseudonocardiales bacterium]
MTRVETQQPVVVVGLLATPPDQPAEVARKLAVDLGDLLTERVDDRVRWEVRTGWGPVSPRRDGGIDALLDDVAQRRKNEGWDVAICLTDLPLQVDRVPLVAHASAARRVGLISLPALGVSQLRAVRAAVAGLVEGLAGDLSAGRQRPGDRRLAQMVEKVGPIRRVVDHTDDGEVGFASSRIAGRLRLVLGMVRANRPGRALLGLSKLLVGAFGTAAFAMAQNTIWQMGDALDGLRLTVIMVLGLATLVTWLIVRHDLWEKASEHTPKELARLFNIGTVLTLALAAAVCYLLLLGTTSTAAALLIDPSVLQQNVGHPVGPGDYLTLAWLISSLATVGGAVGSGLEDEDQVRAAAYGYHPEPLGWQDQ